MQQVADWLEKLGLGQYAQRFAENDISFAILRQAVASNALQGVHSKSRTPSTPPGTDCNSPAFFLLNMAPCALFR
jgi:hypothetical protein